MPKQKQQQQPRQHVCGTWVIQELVFLLYEIKWLEVNKRGVDPCTQGEYFKRYKTG